MSSARNRTRGFPPAGRMLLALAAARRSLTRAFSIGSFSRGGDKGCKPLGRPALAIVDPTPPESPAPPDDDVMSFFLLRHGETNFNAVGRIQVCVFVFVCVCVCLCRA